MVDVIIKRRTLLLIVLLLGPLVLAAAPVPVSAYDCTDSVGDSDGDGLSDALECEGVPLDCDWDPGTATTFDNFPGLNSGLDRADRLDPAEPDLFVALIVTTPPSGYGRPHSPLTEILLDPAIDPLEMVNRSVAEGGLGLTAHRITAGFCVGADRVITSTPSIQKAAYITESMSTTDTLLGEAQYGTPNGPDDAVIYTQNIIDHLDGVCFNAVDRGGSCQDASGAAYDASMAGYISDGAGNLDSLKVLYMQNTLAHELGHMVSLRVGDYFVDLGGHHYPSDSGYVLDQNVVYDSVRSKGKTHVTYHIISEYHPDSVSNKIVH